MPRLYIFNSISKVKSVIKKTFVISEKKRIIIVRIILLIVNEKKSE